MGNILIINEYNMYPVRMTAWDHIYCFKKYASCKCFYYNIAARRFPKYLLKIPFDAIIFHTHFLSSRWTSQAFKDNIAQITPLKNHPALKIALPQDEFLHTDILCDFINDFGIDIVYSVIKESEWKKVYKTVDFNRVTFKQILTGYIEEKFVKEMGKRTCYPRKRTIDIGYRACHAPYWLGRHGMKKIRIAEVFNQAPQIDQTILDISTKEEDTLLGKSWYDFLLNCSFVIGVEGGASILDRDGTIKKKTEEYLKHHPKASFEEVEKHCFPNVDGQFEGIAISPRHFEACVTKTAQILMEGEYNGILKPGLHYIELKQDYSNLAEIFSLLKDENSRQKMVENAYKDIVLSEKYTYRAFVQNVMEDVKSKTSAKKIPSLRIYPNKLKSWDSGLAKASGFDLPKSTPYYNIGSISEVESRELLLKSETNFSTCLGIFFAYVHNIFDDYFGWLLIRKRVFQKRFLHKTKLFIRSLISDRFYDFLKEKTKKIKSVG